MSPKSKLSGILAFIILGVLIHPCFNLSLRAQTTSAQQWTQLYEGMSSNTQIESDEDSSPGNQIFQQSQERVRVPGQFPERQIDKSDPRIEGLAITERQRVISNLEQKLQPYLNKELIGDQPLKQFGYDQLRADRFQFDPIANPSLPRNYFLGPGDEVLIHDSLGKSGAAMGVQGTLIDPSGLLHIPGVEPIKAWNLTLDQLNEELRTRTKFLYATLGRLRSIQVNLIGEANRPGLHRVPAIASVYNVLALAGGVKKSGSLRQIQWKRGNQMIAEIDLYEYLLKGETLKEITLKSGDTLFIPLLQKAFAVTGAVKRPAIYETKDNITFNQALELAGGLQVDAMGKIQIERTVPGQGRMMIRVSLDNNDSRNQMLENFDVVKIFPTKAPLNVSISGEVIKKPGTYPLLKEMILADLIVAAGGLGHPESTDLTVFITRWEYNDLRSQRKIYKIQLNPETLKTKPSFNLKRGDAVLIRHHSEYRKPMFVTIAGEVQFPGTYEFELGTRLSEIIKQAGGYTDQAFLEGAIFTRNLLIEKEKAIDIRLRKDSERALLQSTVAASSSLTSPQTQLQAVNAIREGLNKENEIESQLSEGNEIESRRNSDEEKTEVSTVQDINQGRVIIRLRPINELQNTVDDLELRDGDILTIPQKSNTIMVKGETLGEASIPYSEGEEADYYIDQLGGIRDSADLDDVYVIQASGIVIKDSGYDIRQGDTIIVPPDLRPKESTIKEYATVVDIIFKTFTTIAILYSIGILQAPSAIGMLAF